jgi:TonB family protein
METKHTDESAVFRTIANGTDRESWLFSLLRQVRESYANYKNPPAPAHVTAEPDPDAVGLLIEQPTALGSMLASVRGMIDDWRHPRTYDVEAVEVDEIWGGKRYKTKLFTFIAYAAFIGVAVAIPRGAGSVLGDETVIPIALVMPDKVTLPDKPIEPKPVPKAKPQPPTNPKPAEVSGGGEVPKRALETPPPPEPPPPAAGGGGGGGKNEDTPAKKGEAPEFAKIQLVPAMVPMNENPVLAAPPTIVAKNAQEFSFNIKTPPNIGDPFGVVNGPPSQGRGTGGGIGEGNGRGVGSGDGPGKGPGSGGGEGGGKEGFIAGNTGTPCIPPNCGNGGGTTRGRITPPSVRRQTKPPYSEDARKNKVQGTVILDITVKEDGTVDRNTIKLVRKQGYGLDENAIEDVKTWLFNPATQDGRPIAFTVRIEVNFALR